MPWLEYEASTENNADDILEVFLQNYSQYNTYVRKGTSNTPERPHDISIYIHVQNDLYAI